VSPVLRAVTSSRGPQEVEHLVVGTGADLESGVVDGPVQDVLHLQPDQVGGRYASLATGEGHVADGRGHPQVLGHHNDVTGVVGRGRGPQQGDAAGHAGPGVVGVVPVALTCGPHAAT
jgi:hypothetical protein